jgi:hypothetical protein
MNRDRIVKRSEREKEGKMLSRRFAQFVLVVTLALAAAALALGCSSGGDDGTETYSDPTYGFGFEYPADWKVVTSDTAGVSSGADPVAVVAVGDPDGAVVDDTGLDLFMVRVYELTQVVDAAALPEVLPYLEELVAALQDQDPTWKVEEPLAETSVGGIPGYQTSASFDWDAGTPMKTTSYFLFAGDLEYQLVLQAAAENWEADQAVFAAILASCWVDATAQ